jgi:PAS domain S-box-containing protein
VQAPPAPLDEIRRLRALRTLRLLDTLPEERFDRITRLACRVFNVPMALVSLVDRDRQWFKSKQGLDACETSRDISFCGHTIAEEGPLVVLDALLDPRFADNPLVTGAPNIRFYAGQPVHGIDGSRIGTLCLIDRQPRMLTREDFQLLADLAALIDRELSIEAALSNALIENADDAIIAKTLDGTIVTWNSAAERTFGYTAADIIGESITRLFPPDRLHEEGELIARVVLGKNVSHFVTRRVRKDGAHIDVSVTLSPVRDAGGNIVAVSKIARDITSTHQRQLAMAISAAIVEHSDDAIISKTLDGTVTSWNSGAERLFGYTAAEIMGLPITCLFPPDRLDEETDIVAQLKMGKKISHFETRRIRKDGTSIDVSVSLSPVRDAQGTIVAISKIARDITDRNRRQLALILANAIVEHSEDAIISNSLDGTVVTWNPGAEHVFGYTAAEMIGGSIIRLLPDDRLSEEAELIAKIVLGKSVTGFNSRRIHKDGTCFDMSVTLYPVHDADGRIVGVSRIVRDLTEPDPTRIAPDSDGGCAEHDVVSAAKHGDPTAAAQDTTTPDRVNLVIRQSGALPDDDLRRGKDRRTGADRALSEKIDELVRNEQRFQTLVRLTSLVVWTTNPEGHFDSLQPGWAAFTGQSFEEYRGAGWSAAVHPADAQPTLDEWTRCVAERRPFLFEQRVRRHDGVFRSCTINAAPVQNDDGSIREWVGVHSDITERRQQEDEIRAQEAKFRVLTDAMPQFVWTCRPDGWMEYFNQRWFDYTGLTLERSQGWGWGAAVHPDDVQHCVRTWNDALERGMAYEVEFRFRRASDGAYRWHLARGVPFRDAQGTIVKWLGTATDIDDYKAEEAKNRVLRAKLEDRVRQRTAALEAANRGLKVSSAKLERSNRELLEFASVASHDLQEPLRKVRTFGDRLNTLCAGNLDEQGRDYLNRMLNAAGRMQTLIQDLLAFSRVGSRPRSFVAVDLALATREVLSDLEILIAETGAQVEVSDLPTIDADPVLIRQLLQNLIANALKFHKKGQAPMVRVSAARSDSAADSTAISVADQGIGFEEKYLDRIFTMFQRLHGRDEYEGTGVGLAICRKIAWCHGGDITATSRPGHGSVFTVTLPMIFDGTKTQVGPAHARSK